jgi:hypothetical protein
MTKSSVTRNRHIVDRLADAKAALDEAERVYNEIRAEVLASGERLGDEYEVSVKSTERVSLDRKSLEAFYGRELSRFKIKKTVVVVMVQPRKSAGRKAANRGLSIFG